MLIQFDFKTYEKVRFKPVYFSKNRKTSTWHEKKLNEIFAAHYTALLSTKRLFFVQFYDICHRWVRRKGCIKPSSASANVIKKFASEQDEPGFSNEGTHRWRRWCHQPLQGGPRRRCLHIATNGLGLRKSRTAALRHRNRR